MLQPTSMNARPTSAKMAAVARIRLWDTNVRVTKVTLMIRQINCARVS